VSNGYKKIDGLGQLVKQVEHGSVSATHSQPIFTISASDLRSPNQQ